MPKHIAPKVTGSRRSSMSGKDKKIALLTRERDEALERQAAATHENARLLNELRESLEQKSSLRCTYLISRSTFDLPNVSRP